jgi:hypothetical protein
MTTAQFADQAINSILALWWPDVSASKADCPKTHENKQPDNA